MSITNFNCCHNLPSPNQKLGSSCPSLPAKPNQVLAWNNNDHGLWTNRCVLGITTSIMIGLEMGSLVSAQSHAAIAEGMPLPLIIESAQSSDRRVAKWSDKRMCPQWSPNSLETIVPENLPRPSAQRRSEVIGYSKDAPAVRTVARSSGNCFAM